MTASSYVDTGFFGVLGDDDGSIALVMTVRNVSLEKFVSKIHFLKELATCPLAVPFVLTYLMSSFVF